jgi:hypothetical protein
MKYVLTSLLSILSLFNFTIQNDTDFEISNTEYIDQSIVLTLKMTSDNIMAVEQEMTYNSDEFELEKIKTNYYFTYTEGKPIKDGKNTTIKMLFDSTYSFKTIEYAQIYFKPLVKDKPLNIYFNNIHSSDIDYKYESSYGCREEITVYSDSDNIKIVKEDYTLRNQVSKWADEHQTLLILICVALIALIILANVIRAIKAKIRANKNPFKTVEIDTNTFNINNQNTGIESLDNLGNTANTVNTPATQEFIVNEQLQKINDDQIGGAQLAQIEAEAKAEAEAQAQQVENTNNNETSSDDTIKIKYEVLILLLLVGTLLFTSTAFADETKEAKLTQIRNNIVNNEKYDSTLDANKDKKVNLIDLIYEIGTTDALNKGYIKFHSTEEEEKKEQEEGPIKDEEETDMNNMWDKVQ